jgi:hypothetical protein
MGRRQFGPDFRMSFQPRLHPLGTRSIDRGRIFRIAVYVLPLIVAMAACQESSEVPSASEGPDPVRSSTEPQGDATAIIEDEQTQAETLLQNWRTGPHADTFVVTADGTNSTCARCHAPVNWIPTMDDIPESCLTCKFTIDPPPPYIPEAEWQHVECIVCHRVDKEEVEAAYAWLAIAPIEEYEEVTSATELCLKCHAGDGVPEHFSVYPAGAHEGMECPECHDSHDGSAGCADAACHPETSNTTVDGHDEAHSLVACEACHDASEMPLNPREEDGIWSTWLTSADSTVRPFSSHDIVLEAPCDRCHYADNPWDLTESVDTGAP